MSSTVTPLYNESNVTTNTLSGCVTTVGLTITYSTHDGAKKSLKEFSLQRV